MLPHYQNLRHSDPAEARRRGGNMENENMRKLFAVSFLVTLFVTVAVSPSFAAGDALHSVNSNLFAGNAQEERTVLNAPPQARRRRIRGDVRRRHRGIGHAYGRAGRSAARGSKRLATNTVHGRPVRGGKEFGKGMGGFGKHTGIGTARVGKKIGRGFKRAVTP